MTTPKEPRVTPGVIWISFMLWILKCPVCSTQSSMKGSRRACSASDSERYAPSTIRQYSRTLPVELPVTKTEPLVDWKMRLTALEDFKENLHQVFLVRPVLTSVFVMQTVSSRPAGYHSTAGLAAGGPGVARYLRIVPTLSPHLVTNQRKECHAKL